MQHDLQSIDLTKTEVVLPPPLAAAIVSVRDDLAKSLHVANPSTGWTPAYSLNPQLARQTADFLVSSRRCATLSLDVLCYVPPLNHS